MQDQRVLQSAQHSFFKHDESSLVERLCATLLQVSIEMLLLTGPGRAFLASRNVSWPKPVLGKPMVYASMSLKLRHSIESCFFGLIPLAAYNRSTAFLASTSHTSAGYVSVGKIPSCRHTSLPGSSEKRVLHDAETVPSFGAGKTLARLWKMLQMLGSYRTK